MKKLQGILNERPNFHRAETEIVRAFDPAESFLPRKAAAHLSSAGLTCYGLEPEVLSFIADSVGEGSRTLETGAGCSTLVFAMRGCEHIAVTPSRPEIDSIARFAEERDISLSMVHFVEDSSDRYLPRCEARDLDLVLLDGKHAFPWPILDWFYTADRMRRGGVMLIDDAQLRSVAILAEFMTVDPGWQLARNFSGKALAFRKMRDSIHDVAWHMQPFTIAAPRAGMPLRVSRWLTRALERFLRNR
jgi:hypothetical protein